MKGIENTVTTNFSDLIGNNKKYIVPMFQRDYSWKEEQWDDLWQDILAMHEDDSDHYMGYLVLQKSDELPSVFKIIDGQQRFTTITLFILAIIKAIKKLGESDQSTDENKKRYETLMSTYIGRRDPVSLEYDNILELNKNDDPYYKDYIVKLGDLRSRGLITSQKLMKQCFQWFESKVNSLNKSGKEYANFLIRSIDNLFFTVITVNDEVNAFRVFETLNARGVQLSSADLLKNYLFSLVDDGRSDMRIRDLEYKWNKLATNVRTEKLPDFIRYYWNTKNKSIRSAELFKAIRKNIINAQQVFEFVSEMMAYSDIYMALKDPNDEMWGHDKDIRSNVELLNLFGLKQHFLLLMCAYKCKTLDFFKKILNNVVIVCFRYNVICSKNPNEIEKVFNDMARGISSGETPNLAALRKIYISDSEFVNSFALRSFVLTSRNIKVVRYILGTIEQHVSGSVVDIHDDENSIEHILPQNLGDAWDIDEFKAEQMVNRLGNFCLLQSGQNRDLGNKGYDIKKRVYSSSNFQTTRSIPQHYSEWNEASMDSRQKNMAKKASAIWRLNY